MEQNYVTVTLCQRRRQYHQSSFIISSSIGESSSEERLLVRLHPFNGLFSRTTWVSRYQRGNASLDFNEAAGDVFWMPWHQLDAKNLHLAPDR